MLRELFVLPDERRLLDGALGEQSTARVLHRLGGDGWAHVDHVEFHHFDVDHIAVGPGGVFAVETKWTNHPWVCHRHGLMLAHPHRRPMRLPGPVEQAARNAAYVTKLLRHNFGLTVEVKPILVIWGPGRPHLDQPVLEPSGVTIVDGGQLAASLKSFPPAPVDNRESILQALWTWVDTRDAFEQQRLAIPTA